MKTSAARLTRLTRLALFGLAAGGSFAGAWRWLGSAGEAFWLLVPPWVFLGARVLRVLPPPPRLERGRAMRAATPFVLVLVPAGFYAGLAWLAGAGVSLREMAIAVYFFGLSLEVVLLYSLGAAEAAARRLVRGLRPGPRALGAAAVKLAAYAVLVPFLLATFSVHRVKLLPLPPHPDLMLPCEDVSFPSREERPVRLRGWFIPRPGATRTVIACHGVGANRADLEDILWLLHTAGFNVLCFDFRGHGESDGHTVTYGWLERRDVLGAWDYLLTRRDVDPERVYALGVSMGAAALLQALPELPGVRAAVIDSCFTDLPAMARHQYRWLPGPAAAALARATELFGRVLTGVPAAEVSPLEALARVSIPLLFLHGAEDRIIPPAMSEALHTACRGPKRLRIQPGAGHGGAAAASPHRWQREVREWLAGAGG
ncbi:MAG: alpha/beta fold hydrolase [Planctomycetes bacterium]|nr:alpha/beta fold hydrolase [Planctomycetota bacterium]